MKTSRVISRLAPTVLAAICAFPAHARIKLVALPDREETVVRLDHPASTLVEEERVLSLQKGTNHVDFSWKGVQIDPDSIRLAPLDHPKEVVLINVSYPPNEQALVWEIHSDEARKERVRISYLLAAIDRLVAYEATVEKDETRLDLASFLVLRNFSGEDLARARFRLDYGEAFEKAIRSGETKRMLFFDAKELAITKRFTFDAGKLPWEPEKEAANVGIPVTYEIESKMTHGLWGGKVRLFQKDGRGGTIFTGEDEAGFTAAGGKMKLHVGDSRDVVVTQRRMSEKETNVKWSKEQWGRPRVKVLYDVEREMKVEVENFKDAPAAVTLVEPMPGEWEVLESSHPSKRKDARTLEFEITVPAKQKVVVTFKYAQRNIRG